MGKRNILVPLDGSEFSRQIVSHVGRLCNPATDIIILLRVAEPMLGMIPLPPRVVSSAWTEPFYGTERDIEYAAHPIYASQIEQNERGALERDLLSDQQRLEAVGFTTVLDVRFGDPTEEIAAVVRQRSVDLVAMATMAVPGCGTY